jgi:signal transduction histidine kinase
VVEPYYEKTGDRLRWQLFLPDYLPLLQTDANYLKRILMELLDNACKYTPDGECITVSVQLEQSWLSFSVGNSGVEIPPAEQRRIFERFYRIPTSDPWKHGGTGLGLALVRQLSERLGGQVEVESSNHHSLFTVSFPLTLDNGAS